MSLLLRGEIRVVDYGMYKICITNSENTLMVDAINNIVQAEVVKSDNIDTTDIEVKNKLNNQFAKINFVRTESYDIGNASEIHAYGAIRWDRNDRNGTATGVYMQGGSDGYKLFNLADGVTFLQSNSLHFDMAGNLGIGKHQPDEKLDVEGNVKVTGFVQFGHFTTQERDLLTASNGMVIYNSIDDRFQGYQGGKWINLDDGTDAK